MTRNFRSWWVLDVRSCDDSVLCQGMTLVMPQMPQIGYGFSR
jgi:hypothetical protein